MEQQIRILNRNLSNAEAEVRELDTSLQGVRDVIARNKDVLLQSPNEGSVVHICDIMDLPDVNNTHTYTELKLLCIQLTTPTESDASAEVTDANEPTA